jgi:hypothetical protein
MYNRGLRIKTEDMLMRLSSRKEIDSDTTKRIQDILSPDLDWAYFLKRAQDELLAPLIHKTFLKIEGAKGIVPAERLANSYYSTLGNNLIALHQMQEFASAFKNEVIPAIIFKGLALAESAYADMGLRGGGDIDILVRQEDILRIDKILKALSYSPELDAERLKELSFRRYCDTFFYCPADKRYLPIDIHFHPSNNRHISHSIDLEKLWQDAEPIEFGPARLLTFSKYHQLIYLSMHGLNHSFFPLIYLCDINEFLRAHYNNFNWGRLVGEAFEFGLSKQLYYALFLAGRIFGADIPADTLTRLRPKKISLFEHRFINFILKARQIFVGEGLVYLGMNETLGERISFLRRALLPDKSGP